MSHHSPVSNLVSDHPEEARSLIAATDLPTLHGVSTVVQSCGLTALYHIVPLFGDGIRIASGNPFAQLIGRVL